MTTLDFELEIGLGVAGSYPVVARAPGGEATTTLRWSLTLAELDRQLAVIKDKVLVSSAVVRRAPTENEQPVRELGQRLFEALITGDVHAFMWPAGSALGRTAMCYGWCYGCARQSWPGCRGSSSSIPTSRTTWA
jgi:hypothetical protein